MAAGLSGHPTAVRPHARSARGRGTALNEDGRRIGDWTDSAACSGMDVEAFYAQSAVRAASALRACRGCPVRAQCRAHAVRAKEPFGIWGGLTAAERGWP
ncbi:WhiB family transcriptional regulator [Streptomyces sp. NBC_01264]|nr:WhiB family transcriptional regulator [Streptomyces sp. NBC_01264]